jgi:hypothetical protein
MTTTDLHPMLPVKNSSLFDWIKRNLPFFIFGLVLFIAAYIRFWASSISTGPDVEQFFAFAQVFQMHGLDFYRYSDAQLDLFPMKGWGFFYPPIWILLLALSLFLVPSSALGGQMVESIWRVALKAPIITADLAIGVLLFWAVPGSKWKKLLFASLWLLHPTAWFESGVFGQFDAIAAAFLLGSIILLIKNRNMLAFLLAGLALMTKQHTMAAVAMMIVVCARTMKFSRLVKNCLVMGGGIAVISLPFLVTGNFFAYVRAIVAPGSSPGYQDPLCFSFSGLGAFLSWLHDIFGWDTTMWITLMLPLLVIVLIITGIFCYKKRITPLQAMLAGFLVFVGLYYRINYQYLIIYVPLALLVAATTKYKFERVFTLVIAMLPAVWLWITNIPWWFNDLPPGYDWVKPMLDHLGMPERYLPDWTYVVLAGLIMCTSLAYVVLVFTKWQQPNEESSELPVISSEQ